MKRSWFYSIIATLSLLFVACDSEKITLSVSLLQPGASITAFDEVAIQIDVVGGEPDSVEIQVNGKLLKELPEAPYSHIWKVSEVPVGEYLLKARARLGSAYYESETRTITVQRSIPISLDIAQPAEVAYTNAQTTIALNVSGEEPDSVMLYANNSLLATIEAPYRYTWDTTAVPEGNYLVVARAQLGENTFESPAVTIIVDRTAPRLLERAPKNGAVGIDLSRPITLTFSEAMAKSSITATSVRFVDAFSNSVAANPALSADGKTLAWSIAQNVPVPGSLEGSIQNGLTDLAGNPLSLSNPKWSWSLAAWVQLGEAWNAPLQLAVGEQNRLISQAGGQVFAWNQLGWQSLGGNLQRAESHSVATLNFDTSSPVAVIQDELGQTFYVKRWDGNAWQTFGEDIVLASPGKLEALFINGAAAKLVWSRADAQGKYEALQLALWNGSSWQLSDPIALPSPVSGLRLGLDKADQLIMASHEAISDTATHVFVRRWTGVWEQIGQALFEDSEAYYEIADLLINSSGNPVVAYTEFTDLGPSGLRNLLFVRQWKEDSWQAVGNQLGFDYVREVRLAQDHQAGLDNPEDLLISWRESGYDSCCDGRIAVAHWSGLFWERLEDLFLSSTGENWVKLYDLKTERSGNRYIAIQRGNWSYLMRYNQIN